MGHLPDDFERMFAGCIAPGEEAGVAEVLEEASAAGDRRLAEFLEAVAERVARHPERLRAAEVRALLRAAR